jgi:hypothetical protein
MNRKSVIALLVVLVIVAAVWGGGRWLWKGLLALHGVH